MDCPTVGFGASGAGIAGGDGFGPSWISPDCNARKLAALLWEMGQRDEAISVLHKQFPDLFPTPAAAPVQPVSAQAARDPKWCRTVDLGHARLSGADEARYQAECR